IAIMHTELVDRKKWIGEERFLHALNYCMLLPGPEAQQLATYTGWLLHGTRGGLIAGTLFVVPGALVMLALSLIYVTYGELALVEAAFFGIKAAVLAIVAQAILRIGRRALAGRVLVALAVLSFVAIFFFAVPFPALVLAAGAFGWLAARHRPGLLPVVPGHGDGGVGYAPARSVVNPWSRAVRILTIGVVLWAVPVLAAGWWLGAGHVLVQEGVFFSKMAVVTFGGAYAVLSYIGQQAVETYGWLSASEMLDGLGLAETTPGPLIMVAQFVGFLAAHRNPGPLDPVVAATLGAALTTWVTFVPCFLWIFLGAPHVEALRGNRALTGALTAITASIVGVVANLAVWFALHLWFADLPELWWGPLRVFAPTLATADLAAIGLSLAALVLVLRFKLGMLTTLALSAAAGVVISVLA
ncbi:MAG: chromate efflux transporter, partial [Alphaproteobacteria bacterium]|nr:chromate efflux transporter [Alphaproteobacteria bacterium]